MEWMGKCNFPRVYGEPFVNGKLGVGRVGCCWRGGGSSVECWALWGCCEISISDAVWSAIEAAARSKRNVQREPEEFSRMRASERNRDSLRALTSCSGILTTMEPRSQRGATKKSWEASPCKRVRKPRKFLGSNGPPALAQGATHSGEASFWWARRRARRQEDWRCAGRGEELEAGALSFDHANQVMHRTLRMRLGIVSQAPMRRRAMREAVKMGLQASMARAPSTTASSPRLRAIFDRGSGDVFATRRVPAFVACAVREAPPARRAAMTRMAGWASPKARMASRRPPTGRMKVWMASFAESSHGILSAKNSRM